MKTPELTGAQLDWAVAKCEGLDPVIRGGNIYTGVVRWTNPSTDWAQGGPIIECEQISIVREYYNSDDWTAYMPSHVRDESAAFGYGPTPLTAAMRCYVAAKLGDEVEIPKELT
jgi:hypothetical protein